MSEHQIMSLDESHDDAVAGALEAVRAGECVVLPTDTVYGIGADAFSADAVKKLLEAKQRGTDMPPPVLIAEPAMLRAFAADVPASAKDLAEAFWPGALTLILKAQSAINLKLGETDNTVAVRVPDHDGARALLRRTGPLAVSSANIHGQDPATTCQGAVEQLGDSVAVYLDAGETPGMTPSTIVDFTRFRGGTVVREGVIAYGDLKKVARRLKPMDKPEADEPPTSAEAPEPVVGPAAVEAPSPEAPTQETPAPDQPSEVDASPTLDTPTDA